jgi:hypothetical protein
MALHLAQELLCFGSVVAHLAIHVRLMWQAIAILSTQEAG